MSFHFNQQWIGNFLHTHSNQAIIRLEIQMIIQAIIIQHDERDEGFGQAHFHGQ